MTAAIPLIVCDASPLTITLVACDDHTLPSFDASVPATSKDGNDDGNQQHKIDQARLCWQTISQRRDDVDHTGENEHTNENENNEQNKNKSEAESEAESEIETRKRNNRATSVAH
jgi:hypothetical protein